MTTKPPIPDARTVNPGHAVTYHHTLTPEQRLARSPEVLQAKRKAAAEAVSALLDGRFARIGLGCVPKSVCLELVDLVIKVLA